MVPAFPSFSLDYNGQKQADNDEMFTEPSIKEFAYQ